MCAELRSSGGARVARPVSATVFKKIKAIRLSASRTSVRCNGEPPYTDFARFIRSVSKNITNRKKAVTPVSRDAEVPTPAPSM